MIDPVEHTLAQSNVLPDIFTLYAVEQTKGLLQLSIKELVQYLTNRSQLCNSYSDEICLVLDLLLERFSFARSSNSSLVESYYGIERMNCSIPLSLLDLVRHLMISTINKLSVWFRM